MRISHVIASLDPEMGGLPKTTVAQAASQSVLGHEVQIVYFDHEGGDEALRSAFGHFPGYDEIVFCSLKGRGYQKVLGSGVTQALEDFGPDLLHTHGLWEPMLAYAQRYGLKKKVPYVVFPQSMLHPWQSRKYPCLKGLLKYGLGWKKRWQKAAFIQVLSEQEAMHWHQAGIPQTRLIPNGIFPTEDLGGGGALPWGEGDFLLSLARLHPQKSPDLLLKSFAKVLPLHPEVTLVFAGPDYGMEEDLRALASQLGCAESVYFAGSLHAKEKWRALHACKGFVLPSQAEGFSLALLEAALAGAEIVMSKGCYFDALAEAGGARIAALTPEELAEALRMVLSHPGAMGPQAREFVLQGYTWERIAEQLIAAYREVGA
ncbi:glycosyltransferase [Kiritimatiellota bacterium B12222]|nr:glycosyltransferase [Kiritimatiellota bacterium B12222]